MTADFPRITMVSQTVLLVTLIGLLPVVHPADAAENAIKHSDVVFMGAKSMAIPPIGSAPTPPATGSS